MIQRRPDEGARKSERGRRTRELSEVGVKGDVKGGEALGAPYLTDTC